MSFIRTIEQFCAHVRVNVSGTDLDNVVAYVVSLQ